MVTNTEGMIIVAGIALPLMQASAMACMASAIVLGAQVTSALTMRSPSMTFLMQAAGFEVICLEARQVKNTPDAMRNKTNRNDARGIAQILRTGWYIRVRIKSLHSHRVRALLASRKAILAKCVDLENELRDLLRVLGIRLASRVGHGSFDAQVRSTFADDEMLSCALVPLLDARTVLYKTYLKLDNAVKALTKADPLCVRLMSIPGVGPVTALTFKSAVDDPARFKSSRNVAAHFGLTPKCWIPPISDFH